jgi:hypothetical protein
VLLSGAHVVVIWARTPRHLRKAVRSVANLLSRAARSNAQPPPGSWIRSQPLNAVVVGTTISIAVVAGALVYVGLPHSETAQFEKEYKTLSNADLKARGLLLPVY